MREEYKNERLVCTQHLSLSRSVSLEYLGFPRTPVTLADNI
jgi:hypothetical protein